MLLRICLTLHKHSSYAGHIQNEGTLLPDLSFLKCPSCSLAQKGLFSQFLWRQRQGSCSWATGLCLGQGWEKRETGRKNKAFPQTPGPIFLIPLAKKMKFLSEFQLPVPSHERKETNPKPKSRKLTPKLALQILTSHHCLLLFTYIACFCILSRVVSSNQQKR